MAAFDDFMSKKTMSIKETLKQLPLSPGVYMMIDSLGNTIYVGKAKKLKDRVSQYFRNQKDRAPKVEEMINNIYAVKYLVTDTELDAFIEECRLIKEIKPRYNKLMKNSCNYQYIKIPAEQYPKVLVVKEKYDDGALYFGPFTSRHSVETTIAYLNEYFPIRKCTSPGLAKTVNGCLFKQLGACLGVCTGRIRPEEYSTHIESIKCLLNGDNLSAIEELLNSLNSAIENLQFEKAAQYKEYYLGLKHIIGKQRLVKSSIKNRNILAIEFVNPDHPKLFFIKGNKLFYREVIDTRNKNILELKHHIKQTILNKFGQVNKIMPRLSQNDIDEAQIIYSYLKNSKKIICFSLPASYFKKEETFNIDIKVDKIVNRITTGN
ncbi:GIY-YIG nuclease family protein [Desulfosporosinus sp. SYSU MS00001]|uniref:GIY-YIG nuclease family protein n=1 Tax=Desulfosporosinus sp. SYSU MS00001 TaxID=3416284 RepID=UPI003CFAC068